MPIAHQLGQRPKARCGIAVRADGRREDDEEAACDETRIEGNK
jgi:hypothetical protein